MGGDEERGVTFFVAGVDIDGIVFDELANDVDLPGIDRVMKGVAAFVIANGWVGAVGNEALKCRHVAAFGDEQERGDPVIVGLIGVEIIIEQKDASQVEVLVPDGVIERASSVIVDPMRVRTVFDEPFEHPNIAFLRGDDEWGVAARVSRQGVEVVALKKVNGHVMVFSRHGAMEGVIPSTSCCGRAGAVTNEQIKKRDYASFSGDDDERIFAVRPMFGIGALP